MSKVQQREVRAPPERPGARLYGRRALLLPRGGAVLLGSNHDWEFLVAQEGLKLDPEEHVLLSNSPQTSLGL